MFKSLGSFWGSTRQNSKFALLSFVAAASALAQTPAPSDPPPSPPTWATADGNDPSATVFVYDASAGEGTVKFLPAGAGASGYRLYLGTSARSDGNPYSVGGTPCDLGAGTLVGGTISAKLKSCASPTGVGAQQLHLALTAYNVHGNEGDYSEAGIFVPVTPPTVVTSSAAGGADGAAKSITINWTRGTAPGGATVETQIFRRRLTKTGEPVGGYTKLTVPTGVQTLTDSDPTLDKDTIYEYTLRSIATVTGGTRNSYSTNVVKQQTTPKDIYSVTLPGGKVASNPQTVATLEAGDSVVLSNAGSQVTFQVPVDPGNCGYVAAPSGFARSTFDNPNNQVLCGYDQDCTPGTDPITSSGHAALLMKRNSSISFVGGGTTQFDVTSSETLSLLVNDCKGSNNSGNFTVTVTVSRP